MRPLIGKEILGDEPLTCTFTVFFAAVAAALVTGSKIGSI